MIARALWQSAGIACTPRIDCKFYCFNSNTLAKRRFGCSVALPEALHWQSQQPNNECACALQGQLGFTTGVTITRCATTWANYVRSWSIIQVVAITK